MDLGLGGRGYLLTGASRGLGFATARALVDDGARVLISSRSADAVGSSVEELGGEPAAFGTAADLAEPEAVPRLVDEARSRLGRIDGALISVGGPTPGTVFQTTVDDWRDAYESVVLGPLELVRTLSRTWTAAPRSGWSSRRRCASPSPTSRSPTGCGRAWP